MLKYTIRAARTDSHGSEARCKGAVLLLDTDVSGRADAFNPAELFLASIAACMIKGALAHPPRNLLGAFDSLRVTVGEIG